MREVIQTYVMFKHQNKRFITGVENGVVVDPIPTDLEHLRGLSLRQCREQFEFESIHQWQQAAIVKG